MMIQYYLCIDAHKDILNFGIKSELKDRLEYLLNCKPEDIKYKVHKRALKVLRPEIFKYPVTLAKDCKL